MTGKIMLTATVSLLLTAAWSADNAAPVNAPTAPAPAAVKDAPKTSADAPKAEDPKAETPRVLTEEEKAKIQALETERRELLRKIQQKRMELLKNNPKLRKIYLDILRQTQELAIELDSNMDIRDLNRALREVETQLKDAKK